MHVKIANALLTLSVDANPIKVAPAQRPARAQTTILQTKQNKIDLLRNSLCLKKMPKRAILASNWSYARGLNWFPKNQCPTCPKRASPG